MSRHVPTGWWSSSHRVGEVHNQNVPLQLSDFLQVTQQTRLQIYPSISINSYNINPWLETLMFPSSLFHDFDIMHIHIHEDTHIQESYRIERWDTTWYSSHIHHISITSQAEVPLGPVADDVQHHHGFLHRLDVPSSGLILVAKTYSAYYDLQAPDGAIFWSMSIIYC